jgi:hypothetical protein
VKLLAQCNCFFFNRIGSASAIMKSLAAMSDLLLLLISSDAAAVARLASSARDVVGIQICDSPAEADVWDLLRKQTSLLSRILIMAWGMPAEFVHSLKSNAESNSIPLVACLPPSRHQETDALYDAGANCVINLQDTPEDHDRLRSILEFWSRSATLPAPPKPLTTNTHTSAA